MHDEQQDERSMFRSALGPGKDCPLPSELERLLDADAGAAPPLARHAAECPYCRTELQLMRDFHAGEPRAEEAAAVERVLARMQGLPARPAVQREPWWRGWFTLPRLAPAALALAGVLVAVGIGIQLRRGGPPALQPLNEGAPVLRSNAVVLLSPVGDLQQPAQFFQWQPVPNAARYQVRLLEVDGTELWKAETSQDRLGLPPEVRAHIVPHKTLLWQVSALDAAGRVMGASELVRFRLLQNFYHP